MSHYRFQNSISSHDDNKLKQSLLARRSARFRPCFRSWFRFRFHFAASSAHARAQLLVSVVQTAIELVDVDAVSAGAGARDVHENVAVKDDRVDGVLSTHSASKMT